jgi:protein arginine kinase
METPELFQKGEAPLPSWLQGDGPASLIVLGVSAALHRNLAGFHFFPHAKEAECATVLAEIQEKVDWPEGQWITLAGLKKSARKFLLERQVIGSWVHHTVPSGAVAMNQDGSQVLRVLDKNHLQIVNLQGGFAHEKAAAAVMAWESELEQKLFFAYQEDLGYLTTFVRSVGTGLHLSALVHLPGLVLAEEIDKIINALQQLGLSVRGLFGTHQAVRGSLFKVTSTITLGRDEDEIANDFKYHLGRVIAHEQSAREQLHARDKHWLEDLIHRSYAILGAARLITAQETFDRLSHVRLGVGLGILPQHDTLFLNRLLFGQLTGHLQVSCGEPLKGSAQARARASFLRQCLDGARD